MHPRRLRTRILKVYRFFRSSALALVAVARVFAHDPGLSTTQVDLTPTGLVAKVGFAPNDVRALLAHPEKAPGSTWTQSQLATLQPELISLAPSLVEIQDAGGTEIWSGTSVSLATANSILFTLTAQRRPSGPTTIRSVVMDKLPPGHRNYVSVTDEHGALLVEKLVGANDLPVSFVIAEASTGPSSGTPVSEQEQPTFWGFLRLGIAHIWTGYDHLLFLFGLLVVCRSFKSIVGIISCFTVAHSITLALATLNIVNLPSRVVEPMIAASIFYVGVENLIRKGAEPKGRWALTFGFGLIHGFGFASVLRELGIGSNGHGLAMPLFTFNLGVEIGQISIAALVLPIVWQLRKNPTFVRRGVPILSGIVALAGLYWFLERTVL
jgi:hydrogenase/urease accessory protein HupE